MVDALGILWRLVLSPAGWMPLARHVSLAINSFLLLSLPKAFLRDFWAMQYSMSGMYSGNPSSLKTHGSGVCCDSSLAAVALPASMTTVACA